MYIIEPCCTRRHMRMLRDALGKDGTEQFDGYGDLSLSELLPAILTPYSETELLVAAPSLPDQAADILKQWMRQQWSRRDGNGKLDAIHHLTVIADLSEEKSPMASEWLKDNPFGERMTLVNIRQDETAILLPDFAITGPVNMRYGHHFTATATTVQEQIDSLWKRFATIGEKPMEQKAKPAKRPARKKK